MKNRKWLALALAGIAAFSLVFTACGGGDDDDSGDDDDGGTSSNVKTGSDEKYVEDLCKASKKFATELESVSKKFSTASSASDIEKLMDAFVEPFETFSKDFSKASPPKDLKDWHSEASKQLAAAVKSLKDGDGADALDADLEFPEMPKDADERLSKIADKNKDCQDAEFLN